MLIGKSKFAIAFPLCMCKSALAFLRTAVYSCHISNANTKTILKTFLKWNDCGNIENEKKCNFSICSILASSQECCCTCYHHLWFEILLYCNLEYNLYDNKMYLYDNKMYLCIRQTLFDLIVFVFVCWSRSHEIRSSPENVRYTAILWRRSARTQQPLRMRIICKRPLNNAHARYLSSEDGGE